MSFAPIKGRRRGLRTRIVLYTSAVIGVTLAAAFLWSVYNLRMVLQDRNDAFLRHELDEFSGALSDGRGDSHEHQDDPLELLRHEAAAGVDAGLLVLLKHDGLTEGFPEGAAVRSFEQAAETAEPDAAPHTVAVAGIAAGVRMVCVEIAVPSEKSSEKSGGKTGGKNWTVILGLPLTESEQTVASFNTRLAAGSALFLAAAVLGGLFLTRQALQPVADSIAAARRLNPADLTARLPRTEAGDELDLLAVTVNDLLDRVVRNHEQVVQFTADASHELRGPLSAMQAAIEVTLQQPRSNSDYQDLLATMGEQCHRLADLVNDLLLLAKADAGQIELQRAPVDLADLVAEVVETYRPLAEEQDVSLETPASDRLVCLGDRMRLLQLTMNLVDNAVKFTPRGGKVCIKLAARDAAACLTVEDTGIGIAADHLSRIFERFYQVDESRSADGTGLGLSICRWVATAHGGTIEAASEPGRGTSFRVMIPNVVDELGSVAGQQ
jgi:heavy metal sensor kinase